MKNDLSIRCRFCPVETRGSASGPLLARYKRHLRNCGAAKRVAVERGLPLSEVIGDTLMRSGCADGPSRGPDLAHHGDWAGWFRALNRFGATP